MERDMISLHSRSAKVKNENSFQVQTCIKWEEDIEYNTGEDEREATMNDWTMMILLLR